MAYAFTITTEVRRQKTRKAILIMKVAETGMGTADIWNTETFPAGLIPRSGTIFFQAELGSGAGSTIAPRLGKVDAWSDSTVEQIVGPPTPAAYVAPSSGTHYQFAPGQDAIIYGMSKADAGSDNVGTWLITIEED